MKPVTEILNLAIKNREPVVMCTVVNTSGSTPLKAGAKMLVWTNGKIYGTIGGGILEKRVMEEAILLYESGLPQLKEYALLKEQMCCGGIMQVFIEPMKPQKQLIIFGVGHIGSQIAEYAQNLDFKVVIIDERSELLENVTAGEGEKVCLNHQEAFSRIVFDKSSYVVICTHLHEYDREILAHCINQPHAYLGMIGSMRKVIITKKRFLEQNIAALEQLEGVDMPMGFDIGQNSPAEIALGILAKIVAVANGRKLFQLVTSTSFDFAQEPPLSYQTKESNAEENFPIECVNKPIKHGA
jgi:xanthine dehydrogenase accessory factor